MPANPRTLIAILPVALAFTPGCAVTHGTLPASTAHLRRSFPPRPDVTASPDAIVQRSIDIDASPEHVFAILVDVERWPRWDPSVTRTVAHASRPLEVGDRFYQNPGGYDVEAQVLDLMPGRALRWKGAPPDGNGITGVHSFELVPLAAGRTRVINREEFSRWYLRTVAWATDFGLGEQFARTLAALKRVAETGTSALAARRASLSR
jgi:hypothetical protein